MDGPHYRKQAEKIRAKAARLASSPHQEQLLKVAAQFDRLAEEADEAAAPSE